MTSSMPGLSMPKMWICSPAMNSPSANSSVSPGRNGKNRPHSMKMMTRLSQISEPPKLSRSHSGSIHLIPSSSGVRASKLTRPRYLPYPRAVPDGEHSQGDPRGPERAPYDPMPHGPAEVGVGPWPGAWPTGPGSESYDPVLLADGDRRNVVDRYRYWTVEAIRADLDTRRHGFHVAIENWQHDFNIGTIVRSANAFLAAEVHIVGNRRWNRRGAMVTDRYQHLRHHQDVEALAGYLAGLDDGVPLWGIDNLPGSVPLERAALPERVCLLFGQEGPGLSEPARAACAGTFSIAQFGSTRSINASAAAAIAMHAWIRTHADPPEADAR